MYKKIILLSSLLLTPLVEAASPSSQWEQTLAAVTDSVVSIQVNAVRTFDTESSMSTQATGFVVDAERGIILTNRHVVNPGPVTAEAIFSNSEEIELKPIYRDPVHDFGFFQYDPKALRFIKPRSLPLASNSAKVGDDIKLIGNDSGEHMSILSGTLARLDRSAPKYRRGGYNDFNTFYYQSSADTSGGSSGSPVININGEVIALNAGGSNRSSSSFFLPLYKVTRALKALQQGEPIKRGTIQTTLSYQTFDEARRLGLPVEVEQQFRNKQNGNGLLVVANSVLDGPAYGQLRPGDIILDLKSEDAHAALISRYETFEIFLDEHVGKTIQLSLLRQSKRMQVSLTVEDLHSVSPDEFIQLSGAMFNNFSYQLARQTNLPTKGVYIASNGFMFANAGINRGSVIQSIEGSQINDLNDLELAFSQLQQHQNFTVKYVNIAAPHNQLTTNVKFLSYWHSSQRCKRDDGQGSWQCRRLEWQQTIEPVTPAEIAFGEFSDNQTAKIARSLVMISADLPYHIDGQNYKHYSGTGLVLDAEQGLVLTDRNTVPVSMAEVILNVAGQAELPAEIVFVHPRHSYVLLKFDPAMLTGDALKSARLSADPVRSGDSLWLTGYQSANRLISEKLNISSAEPLQLPMPSVPQFRQSNSNALTINNPPLVASGTLTDKRGRVKAWWTNFPTGGASTQTIDRGLPIAEVINIRDQWLKTGKVEVYSLEAELIPTTLSSARKMGLAENWMKQLQRQKSPQQVLKVARRAAGSDAWDKLQDGDLLLAIDGKLVSAFDQVNRMTRKPQVTLSIWRDGQSQQIDLKLSHLTSDAAETSETRQAYLWSGALIQQPHHALAAQHGIKQQGVYVSWYWYGSPASRYQLKPLHRITEFEGQPVESLAQFIQLSQQFHDKAYVTMRLTDLIGRESIISLKQDHNYWPTEKIFWAENRWRNQPLNGNHNNQ